MVAGAIHGAPAFLSSFIGRKSELAEVPRLLRSSRLLTLTGAGGVGKTRLALEAAAALRDDFPQGLWFVDLAPLTDAVLLPRSIALGLQWDTAIEFGVLEGVMPTHLEEPWREVATQLVRLGEHVPEGVELGYDLCYGDADHQHFVQPKDAGLAVSVANRVCT